MKQLSILLAVICLFCISCKKYDEFSLDDFYNFDSAGLAQLLNNTESKPWRGETFVPGKLGGTWHTIMPGDPKTFNHYVAELDNLSATVTGRLNDYLVRFDVSKREWVAHIAEPRIIIDELNDKMQVYYTLRDDLYWSYYNSSRRVKVTSDDVIFWYNEIYGDPAFNSSGYFGQFIIMPDGSMERKTITKINDRTFMFTFPRIIAEPLFSTNMGFGPRHIYEPAKRNGGVEGVRNIHSVAVDPRTIPSMGEWFLTEYTPSQRLVYKRNPDYWRKDINGVSIPYPEELIVRIIPDENTQRLLFLNGEVETYGLKPEDLDAFINRGDGSYTVYNSEGALSASFWTFNQNPIHSDKPFYKWFIHKEFRQAMSCLLNRDRINTQVYRGLAQPKLSVFPELNYFYNPDITLKYLYDTEHALKLLSSIGIKRDRRGIMRDSENNHIEFNLTIRSESSMLLDIATIIMDELSKVGIKLNIRVIDFQTQIQQLTENYDWESTLIGLSGSQIFPSSGSNVWPSSANLHMWNPNQETPATEWEARIDFLYNEGQFTLNNAKAQLIWDEFQQILLEEKPLIYLMRPRGFFAINNRWDFSNFYYDNMNGAETTFIYLRSKD